MEKRLTTKVQKINPKIPDNSNNISNSIVIEPDDQIALEKKGTIYAVFDVSGKKQFDNLLVTKIVHDVLHDSYYQSESASPIQAVEKAILKLRDNVVKIVTDTTDLESLMSFNIATAILWGNTLYLIQYGSAEIHLMRDGQIKPVSAAKEGSFSVTSGVIKDNDVVILATENFVRTFPPEKLVSTAGLPMDNLDYLQSAMMLKFFVQKKFSSNEVIEFGIKNNQQVEPEKKGNFIGRLFARNKAPTTTEEQKQKTQHTYKVFPLVVVFGLIATLAITASLYKTKTELDSNQVQEVVVTDVAKKQETPEVENQTFDSKTVLLDAPVFYDIKLVNADSTANEIILIDNSLYAVEETLGKVYVSNKDIPKFVEQNYVFSGIKNVNNFGGKLAFIDNGGVKVVNLINNDVEKNYAMDHANVVATYLDFIYTLKDDTLTKNEDINGKLTPSIWAQDADLIGAETFAVNVSIYVLKGDEVLKYTSGERVEFVLSDDYKLNKPEQIVTNEELDNIYIVDSGNKRVLVVKDTGEVTKVIRHKDQKLWTDIRSVTVTPDETTMYLLDGSKVYEVALVEKQEL